MAADVVPLYALYALLFADSGLSEAQISTLFVIWSGVGLVVEVPSGALADRCSRRGCLAWAGVLQALGYVLWVCAPNFPGFAAGFVLWGLGGSLVSGALEALLYDALVDAEAEDYFARLLGQVTAVGLMAQLPAAGAATVLFSLGGYSLVGWASVGCCLAGSVLALRLPEARHTGALLPGEIGDPLPGDSGDLLPVKTGDLLPGDSRDPSPGEPGNIDPDSVPEESDRDDGYWSTLRAGLLETLSAPILRRAILGLALLGAIDDIEEYFPLLAEHWGVRADLVPIAVLGLPLAGACGAMFGGRTRRWSGFLLGGCLGVGAAFFTAAAVLRQPVGLVGVALFYTLYRLVLVASNARLQTLITGRSRATVTSFAELGTGLAGLAVFGIWASAGLMGTLVLVALVAVLLPRLFGRG